MAQLLRLGRCGARVGVAAVGLSAAQFLEQRKPPVRCAPAAQGKPNLKDMHNTILWKKFVAKYGQDEDKQLHFSDVAKLLKDVGIDNQFVASRLFKCMDDDNSGTVSTREMMSFCAKLGGSDRLVKLHFVFDACDLNSNGRIEENDLREFLMHMILCCHEKVPSYSMVTTEAEAAMFADLATDKVALVQANRVAYDLFKVADKDKSGDIDFKEFSFWFQRGDKAVRNLVDLFKIFDLLVLE